MENKIFAFMHCPCVYESAYYTVSLHRTREGAEKALEAHKREVE